MEQIRYDVGRIDDALINDKGYLKSKAYATRAGVFTYMMMDGSIRRELRHPEDVFEKDSIESLAEVVITNNHPPEPLTSANTKKYAAGWTGKEVSKDGKFVKVDTMITDKTTIDDILQRGKSELSCGYNCTIEHVSGEYEGEIYDVRQRSIRYNHLSVVDKGRAGPEVKIKFDSCDHPESIGVMKNDSESDDEKKSIHSEKNKISSQNKDTHFQKKEHKMAKIHLDGAEYEISETLAPLFSSKLKELEGLKADKADLQKTVAALTKDSETLKGKFDAVESELKSAKEKVDELEKKDVSDEEIMKRADALNKVHSFAKKMLGEEHKFDGMSLLDIKKAAIAKANPDFSLDGKSDAYIDGIFDGLVESHSDSAGQYLKNAIAGAQQNGRKFDAKDARVKSMKTDIDNFNSYKGA